MTLTDLCDEISPFPDAENLLDYGGGGEEEANNNNSSSSSFPLQKLRPIRSHSSSNGATAAGDSPNTTTITKLCSGSGSGSGSSSPGFQDEVSAGSSSSSGLSGGSNCSSVDLLLDAAAAAAAAVVVNPTSSSTTNTKEEGPPLWEDIVAKKLEQLGYHSKLVVDDDDDDDDHTFNFTTSYMTTATATTTIQPLSHLQQALHTSSSATTTSNHNHEKPTMVVQSSTPSLLNHSPSSDPIEIANMLVALHSTSTGVTSSLPHHQDKSPSHSDLHQPQLLVETINRKRKACGGTQPELFLLNMVDKVMKKQDQMHTQLMHIIDKHEKDRITREEAWRQQELERQKTEQFMRDQQITRNLALISYIETLLGNQIHIPHTPSPLPVDEHKHDQLASTRKRWPESEVKALVTIRTAVDHKFHRVDPKYNSWEEVSRAMSSMGYSRNPKKCKEKWENINKYFKKTIERGRRPKSAKTCPYFNELDILYKNGIGNPGSTPFEMKNKGEILEQSDLIVSKLFSVSEKSEKSSVNQPL